jgi:SAM-dependent methyltransferase
MPLPDRSFDLVFRQQGLQFFPDRPAPLREMRRVLAAGGRLALSVFLPLERNPFQGAVVEALTRHLGPQVAAPLRAAFSLGSAEELGDLIAGAGFCDVAIRPATMVHRVGPADEFVRGWLAGSPMAEAVARADDGRRAGWRRLTAGTVGLYWMIDKEVRGGASPAMRVGIPPGLARKGVTPSDAFSSRQRLQQAGLL